MTSNCVDRKSHVYVKWLLNSIEQSQFSSFESIRLFKAITFNTFFSLHRRNGSNFSINKGKIIGSMWFTGMYLRISQITTLSALIKISNPCLRHHLWILSNIYANKVIEKDCRKFWLLLQIFFYEMQMNPELAKTWSIISLWKQFPSIKLSILLLRKNLSVASHV